MKERYGLDIPVGFKLDEEYGKRVTLYAVTLLKELGALSDEEIKQYNQERFSWLRHQTEWYDGTGYPDGLSGNDIPYKSRLVSIAEAFDIFYQYYKDIPKTLAAIKKFSGTKFDPALVEVLEKVCKSGIIP